MKFVKRIIKRIKLHRELRYIHSRYHHLHTCIAMGFPCGVDEARIELNKREMQIKIELQNNN